MNATAWMSQPNAAWRITGVAGMMFLVAGGIDAALVWYPFAFGSPEWEFGSVTAAISGLPVPAMGLVLLAMAALHNGNLVLARAAGGAMLVVGVACLAGAALYLTNVPIALTAVGEHSATALLGLQKSIVKTGVQLVAYPVGLFFMALYTFRRSGKA